ncbi:MAG: SurA N-terminal domain-containing protein [Acidobacteriota bacterium]|nr:SurA N-terminal domain-containing protein [Acidobacteriota bacterium]
MLKVFRDNLKYLSWVLWLVIVVFILFVFVDFGGTVNSGSAPLDAAAYVGRDKVTYAEFERAFRTTEDFYRQAYGERYTPEFARQLGLHVQVLDRLVGDKILLAEAGRMGLETTDAELRREITSLPTFQGSDGVFVGTDDYRDILRRAGYQIDTFENEVRTQLLTNKVKAILSDNLYIPPADVEEAYRRQVEKAKIRFLKLDSNSIAEDIDISDSETAAFFSESREDFRIPEKRVVDYVLIDRAQIESTLEIGQDEIEGYYNERIEEFTTSEQVQARHILLRVNDERGEDEARSQLEDARRRIEAGEGFADLAAEVSEDPGSKTQGGDLGFFGRGAMVKPFEDAAFSAGPGTLVGPIQTDFGWHLIEILSRREAGTQPLAEVEVRIRQQLRTERGVVAAESKARDLADRIEKEKMGPDSWAELAAEESGVTAATTAAFGRDESLPEFGRSSAFSIEAFEGAPGSVSEAIPVARGWVILAVRSIEPPRLPELDEVRAEVEQALKERRVQDEALRRLQTAAADPRASERSFDEIAENLGATPEESGFFGRDDSIGTLGPNREVAAAALALDVGGRSEPVALADGALFFEVLERESFDPIQFESEKDSTLATLRNQRLGELLDSLVERRRQELDVSYDPALAQNFGLTDQG